MDLDACGTVSYSSVTLKKPGRGGYMIAAASRFFHNREIIATITPINDNIAAIVAITDVHGKPCTLHQN
jgi:hypothetical protein